MAELFKTETIENTLAREFPELMVEIPSIYRDSNVTEEEISSVFKYIKEHNLIQDSRKLLSSEDHVLRNSVIYPIIFPNQERKLSFKVNFVLGPNVFIGCIQTQDSIIGNDIPQVRLYGMRLRS